MNMIIPTHAKKAACDMLDKNNSDYSTFLVPITWFGK